MRYTTWYNMAEAQQLRAKYTTFEYSGYSWKLVDDHDLVLSFSYQISPEISFNPKATIHNVTQEMIDRLGTDSIDSYVFQIGLAELYSYWKTTASPQVVISAGNLTPKAQEFWHKLLLKGMGEFFYTNAIDFSAPDFVTFSSNSNKIHNTERTDLSDNNLNKNSVTPRVLIPVGGGKDSSVTLELLKQRFSVGTYAVSTPKSAQDIINVSRIPQEDQIKITRFIDPKLFELNEAGYLNGHVPISAYLAFLSIFTADLFGYTHVAISNERSSNEGNVWYCDQEVNHQYSKTYEFESDLQAYVTSFLPATTPLYFSFLRPLYELQIAQIFAQFPDHHPVFRSCNKGQKQNIWCGNCSKCLFAWTILFPFLGEEKLTTYFGNNIFENMNLWQVARELLGLATTKPFDCVGTHEETAVAFYLCTKLYEKENQTGSQKTLPPLLEKVAQELKTNPQLQLSPEGNADFETRAHIILTGWNEENSLPAEFAQILKHELEKAKNR